MIGLWLLFLIGGVAWMAGYDWIVGVVILFAIIANFGLLLTLSGVSKHRHKKQKYHPVH